MNIYVLIYIYIYNQAIVPAGLPAGGSRRAPLFGRNLGEPAKLSYHKGTYRDST